VIGGHADPSLAGIDEANRAVLPDYGERIIRIPAAPPEWSAHAPDHLLEYRQVAACLETIETGFKQLPGLLLLPFRVTPLGIPPPWLRARHPAETLPLPGVTAQSCRSSSSRPGRFLTVAWHRGTLVA